MRFDRLTLLAIVSLAMATTLTGCSEPAETEAPQPMAEGSADAHEGHAHPSAGPHGGSLIELGQEQYHGELVHDEASGMVTIYLLDSSAKQAVPIAASQIMINATHEGNAEQFKLIAQPDGNDPEGKSSRFVFEDNDLGTHLHQEHAQARLVVKIDGQSFNGEIVHDHDHGHEH